MNLRNILEFSCSNNLIVHGPISNSNMAKSFLIEDSELHVYHISNVDNPDIVTGTMSMLATCFSNLQLMLLRIWGWSQNSVCLCIGNFYISTWQNLSFIEDFELHVNHTSNVDYPEIKTEPVPMILALANFLWCLYEFEGDIGIQL